ncbi:T9SS type A sorting domain-containing protein [candidate division WOR-3 bacterium]|uniref:T9SS type A sorting domain-containing protein n=1 Tax=candidate division WOR-3 bacterium TaxID=2052148 RepID=A0A937XF30_UNCW3|nr:T9SS type A sorting domain-containing protein [candidate division WOR-3 bacterium]
MKGKVCKAAAILVALCGCAAALVTAYHVEPITAALSGWTDTIPPNNCVAQLITTNFDELDAASGAYVELFAGEYGSGGQYDLSIRTYPGGNQIAYKFNGKYLRPQYWVRFDSINVTYPESIVKGKKLAFCFTRGGGDSIQYYFTNASGYNYGGLIASYPGAVTPTHGLAMRCYGRMRPVDSAFWGGFAKLPGWNNGTNRRAAWQHYMTQTGWRTAPFECNWVEHQPTQDSWDFRDTDAHISLICSTGARPVGILVKSALWASSREDSTWLPRTPPDTGYDWGYGPVEYGSPLNLWPGSGETNYYARWVDSLMDHAANVHTWIVSNEPNDTCVSESCWADGVTGWWRRPNRLQYLSGFDGPRGLCSLYMRMARVAASTIRSHENHIDDTILIGAMHRATDSNDSFLVAGVHWLDLCYQTSEDGVFWDGVAVHPYQDGFVFSPERLESDAETLRAVMQKTWGDYRSELWNTELGWNVRQQGLTREDDANNLCQSFTTSLSIPALPGAGGGYDRMCWWLPYWHFAPIEIEEPWNWLWLQDDSADDEELVPQYGYYAFKQARSILVGTRLNGRVMMGDSTDDSVRVYEFEDTTAQKKRTWVCWSIPVSDPAPSVSARLPARSDTMVADSLAYDDDPPSDQDYAAASGWLHESLTPRPVLINETSVESRPELVVDSFWVVPDRPQTNSLLMFYALVRNRDTQRATPDNSPTSVWFTWNGAVVESTSRTKKLYPGDTMWLILHQGMPSGLHGEGLLAANVNPGMRYVERQGTDDNQAYLRLDILRGPSGEVDVVVPPGAKTGAPVLPIGLTSASWEKDTTGQTPADSARILLDWYGQRDTMVHATDTTAWFPFCADTALPFPRGCGTFRVYAQFRDSGENDSPFYPDSIDSIIVFDTTGPTGSVVIQGGVRFAPSSTCTLTLAAYDSASGVGWMRFMNRPRVGLIENGGFLATAGSWSFANGAYDTSLAMAKLAAGMPQAGVRQFVPAESISAYSGDSCVLEASILAHVHDGEAAGEVSFWFWSTREDTSQHDTLWELVDSASYSGSLLSLTGRYNLSTRFLLETPTPESGWVWRGGMVRVRAQGVDSGAGNVYTDNVALNAFESDSGYVWWGAYDTLAEWNIGSGAGMKVVRALFLDSAGNENAAPYADTIILDPTAPVVHISLPDSGQLVSGTVEVTGWAYDPIEVAGDTWFESRRLFFMHVDSTNWLPADPDSVSHSPAYPDSQQILGPAVHLGYWNTDSIPDGEYYVLLTGADSAGHVSSCTTWVIVSNSGGGGGEGGGPPGGGSGMGEGSVYVGSATGYVLHLSDDLDSLGCFQVTDSGSQAKVTAILAVGNDSLLVLDAQGKRVHKLHKNGQNRRRLVSNLSQPMDLKRDTNGNFWLVDKGWHRIGKFRSNGTLVFTRGGLGSDSLHFHSPEGIAVKGDLVYVADTKNDRLVAWDTSGHYKATITGCFTKPTAVYVTDAGAIYLTDGNDGRLKGITPLGGNIVAIKTSDSSKLRGLVLSENRHHLFSLAPQPNKVHKLRIQSDDSAPGGQQSAGNVKLPKTLSLAQPFPNPARTRLNIAYALPHQTRVVLKLYDVAGKLVNTLASGEQKPGYYNLTWNRQDAKGRSCACGVYFCTLAAENQRFSRKVVLAE